MPYIKLQSNITIPDKEGVIKSLSSIVAEELGKPETYVMVVLEDAVEMLMGGSKEPTAFVELKSLGLPENSTTELSNSICNFLQEKLDILPVRIYINFSNVERHMWGWNDGTF